MLLSNKFTREKINYNSIKVIIYRLVCIKKMNNLDCIDGSVPKGTYLLFQKTKVWLQDPKNSSQLTGTSVPGDLTSSSGLHMY